MSNFLTDYLADQVDSLEIQSAWGPTIFVPKPFSKDATAPAATPGTPGGADTGAPRGTGFDVARFLKPKVIVHLTNGEDPTFTPYGEPGDSKWPFVVVAASFGFAYLLMRAFRKCPSR